jgi:hypothetical protein
MHGSTREDGTWWRRIPPNCPVLELVLRFPHPDWVAMQTRQTRPEATGELNVAIQDPGGAFWAKGARAGRPVAPPACTGRRLARLAVMDFFRWRPSTAGERTSGLSRHAYVAVPGLRRNMRLRWLATVGAR